MWTDTRSVEETAYMMEHYKDRIFEIGYQMPSPTWTMLQLMWIGRHEPETLKKTKRAMFVKDYVRYQLTGIWTILPHENMSALSDPDMDRAGTDRSSLMSPALLTGIWTTDYIEAQGSLLFDNKSWGWSEELGKISGGPISILPPVVKPTDVVGHITREMSGITVCVPVRGSLAHQVWMEEQPL